MRESSGTRVPATSSEERPLTEEVPAHVIGDRHPHALPGGVADLHREGEGTDVPEDVFVARAALVIGCELHVGEGARTVPSDELLKGSNTILFSLYLKTFYFIRFI